LRRQSAQNQSPGRRVPLCDQQKSPAVRSAEESRCAISRIQQYVSEQNNSFGTLYTLRPYESRSNRSTTLWRHLDIILVSQKSYVHIGHQVRTVLLQTFPSWLYLRTSPTKSSLGSFPRLYRNQFPKLIPTVTSQLTTIRPLPVTSQLPAHLTTHK